MFQTVHECKIQSSLSITLNFNVLGLPSYNPMPEATSLFNISPLLPQATISVQPVYPFVLL